MQSRRPKIRPPRKSLTAALDFPSIWSTLSQSILQILNQNAGSLSFEELYRKGYNIVLKKHGGILYESIGGVISGYLEGCYTKLINVEEEGDGQVLDRVIQLWRDFEISMKLISDVFLYLDKVYTRENHLLLVYDHGVTLFRDLIIKRDQGKIGNLINEKILDLITANRAKGAMIDFFKIKEVMMMYLSLEETDENGVLIGETYYTLFFERYYLDRSGSFYEGLAGEQFQLGNGRAYLKWVEGVLLDEENKMSLYLNAETCEKLRMLMSRICIVSKIDQVLRFPQESLRDWVHLRKEEELTLLYRLLSRAGYFDGLLVQIDEIIKDEEGLKSPSLDGQGKEKVKISQVSTVFVTQVIALKDKYDQILRYLSTDANVQKTIETSFTSVLNPAAAAAATSRLSEFLSYYIDEFIKKSKDSNDTEISAFLDNAIVIFRFIKDKDVFEKFYKNHLAKRLLKAQSEKDDDLERMLIDRFRNEIGSTFTAKLEGMFKDIHLSRELSAKFNHKNLHVSVLTKTFWPIQPTETSSLINLPSVLEDLQSQFTQYYTNCFNGRNIQWVYNFGTVDIRVKFTKKLHELNCSIYCGVIILLFQEFEQITYKELKQVTQIPEAELKRALLSLSVAQRTRVLLKSPMSKEFQDDDVFKFNYNFTAPLTKVKILTVITKQDTDATRSETLKETETDRKYEVDAMIVRVMKSNKTLSHRELIEEIIKLSAKRFEPSVGFIKKRVEMLIEREYLRRDETDSKVYHYLA
ncbi:hypothetical protein WICPIJ_002528 [Wickerhamomyces pijperi]|uniref:Cullin family profile domain-containing protein n=1 Tax=Wickerhamomyces pijperi TaxID=599730 RepID=A0A9P8QBM7_WICPI|nr:hypothetical protein WICPIJ_002528 [Wickerhamomyces pijperi]